MKYTYDDIITAKDILTGKVKKENIIGKKGLFLNCIPMDMSLNTLTRIGYQRKLVDVELIEGFCFSCGDDNYLYFLPEKEESALNLRFKVGDKVFYNGKTTEVIEADETDRFLPYLILFDGIPQWVTDSELEPDEPKLREKTYEERQAEWVEANNIKIGDKVRVADKWNYDGLRVRVPAMDPLLGKVLEVRSILSRSISLWAPDKDGFWYLPYTMLEKVEDKPEYVPFDLSREEDRQLLRGKWIKSNQNREEMITGFHTLDSGEWTVDMSSFANATGEGLLRFYTFLDGSPCGKQMASK